MMRRKKIRVLFVCAENRCRSPMAEGLLRQHLKMAGLEKRVVVRSAGARVSSPGMRPDQRAIKVAQSAGFKLSRIRSRALRMNDLISSDLVLAMDRANADDLRAICPAEHRHKIKLLLEFSPASDEFEVQDPYFGSVDDFQRVFHSIESAMELLTSEIAGIV